MKRRDFLVLAASAPLTWSPAEAAKLTASRVKAGEDLFVDVGPRAAEFVAYSSLASSTLRSNSGDKIPIGRAQVGAFSIVIMEGTTRHAFALFVLPSGAALSVTLLEARVVAPKEAHPEESDYDLFFSLVRGHPAALREAFSTEGASWLAQNAVSGAYTAAICLSIVAVGPTALPTCALEAGRNAPAILSLISGVMTRFLNGLPGAALKAGPRSRLLRWASAIGYVGGVTVGTGGLLRDAALTGLKAGSSVLAELLSQELKDEGSTLAVRTIVGYKIDTLIVVLSLKKK